MSILTIESPDFDARQAEAISSTLFGVQGVARPLASERDRNFLITSDAGRQYVLKIANAAESRPRLECENAALAHIEQHDPGLAVPRVQVSVHGDAIEGAKDNRRRAHYVRLFSYLPGELLAKSVPDDGLLHGLGCFVARLGAALVGFDHEAATRPDFPWNLDSTDYIREHIHAARDPVIRDIVERFLQRYDDHLAAALEGLPRLVIHNDANDHNVLVDGKSIAGIIDFGDLARGRRIDDVAVTLAYAMMRQDDPLHAACVVLGGYCTRVPLTERELAVLLDLVIMRLATSICVSCRRGSEHPDNEYLLVSQRDAVDLLGRLDRINPEFVECAFRHGCGFPAVAGAPRVVDRLQRDRGSAAWILGLDLSTEAVSRIDFSTNSADVRAFAEGSDFDSRLASRLKHDHARVALGAYDEDRVVYTTDAFRSRLDPGQRRSTHLGIDLFAATGTPVYAPLGGVLVSAVDNAATLDYGPTLILRHTIDETGQCFYTLYGHLSRESLAGKHPGMPIERGKAIATLGSAEVNGGWPPHLHFQIMTTLLGSAGNFPGVGEPKWMPVWRQITPDPNLVLNIPGV